MTTRPRARRALEAIQASCPGVAQANHHGQAAAIAAGGGFENRHALTSGLLNDPHALGVNGDLPIERRVLGASLVELLGLLSLALDGAVDSNPDQHDRNQEDGQHPPIVADPAGAIYAPGVQVGAL